MMKVIFVILGLWAVLCIYPAEAGIAELIGYLTRSECNKADKKGISFCTQKKDGKVYYMKKGNRYKTYKAAETSK